MTNELEFPDCQVDIETTGLSPDRTAIIQIAAVRFNLREGTVCPNVFCKSLLIPPHRHWDQETQAWWSNQKRSVLEEILSKAEKPEAVMNAFFDWTCQNPSKHFWSKPLSFDASFVQSYFRDYSLPMPWSYRLGRDVNTFISTLYYPDEPPKIEISDHGDAHNALADCFYQIELVCKHYQLARSKQN